MVGQEIRADTPEAGSGTEERALRDKEKLRAPAAAPYLLALLVTWLLLLPTLAYPLGRDQSVFAYLGRVIAHGGMPYRDAWDLKPPAIYLAYAGVIHLAELFHAPFSLTLRIFDLLLAGIVALLLTRLATRLGARWAGPLAAGWYALLYLRGGFWNLSQAEVWANLPLLGASLLALEAREDEANTLPYGLIAGILVGVAALLKWTSVLAVAPFLALPLFRRGRFRWIWALTFSAGAALPLLATFLWLKHGGAWEAYLDIQRGFVAPYTRLGASSLWMRIPRMFGFSSGWLIRMSVPVLLAGVGAWKGHGLQPGARRLILLSLLGAFLSVCVQDKYFGYHWLPLYPALSILAGAGYLWLAQRLHGRSLASHSPSSAIIRPWLQRPLVLGLGVVALTAAYWHGRAYMDAARYASGSLSTERWLWRFGPPYGGDFSCVADHWAGEYIRAHTHPEDQVLIWGFESPVYLLSGREAPTRFFFDVPLTVHFAPESWRAEFLRDVQARPPELFLIMRNDKIPWATGRKDDSTKQLAEWGELARWVSANYREETEIEDFTILRLKRAP